MPRTRSVSFSRAARSFHRKARKVIEELEIYPRRHTWLDVTLTALLNRALNTVESIALLSDRQCGADADALSRSVVEIWIVIRWITNKDSHERARKYGAFEGKLIQHAVEALKTHNPGLQVPQHPQHAAIVEAASAYRNHIYWAGPVRMMAEEPDEHEVTPQGAPIDLNWFYDVPYFMSSWHIRSNAMGVRDLYPDFSAPIRFKTGSNDRLCEQAVVLATNCLTLIMLRLGREWGLDISARLESLWRREILSLI